MSLESTAHLLSAILPLASSIPPLYVAYRVRLPPISTMSILLGMFALVHGSSHLLFYFFFVGSLSDLFFPAVTYALSVILMLFFGIHFSQKGGLLK